MNRAFTRMAIACVFFAAAAGCLWLALNLHGVGAILFVAPTAVEELVAFLMVAGIFIVVFAAVIWLNRRASVCIEESAKLLTD